MQTARDFLADKGLAIRNARGKFSREAMDALNAALAKGMEFSDFDANGRIKRAPGERAPAAPKRRVVADTLVAATPVRQENIIRVVDRFGITINVDHCHQCTKAVPFCRCSKGPYVSDWLFREANNITLEVRETV